MSKRTRRNLADPLRFWGGDHSLRRCGHEEWRDWAGLPSELIDDVAGRLLRYDVAEYLRLRAACKEWRDRTAADPRRGGDMPDSRFRPRRWIMLSNNTDGARRRFLNLATGACAQVDLPELSDHHLETSTEGFLVLRDKASDAIRLLNPLTRALTDLPSITVELRSMSPTSLPAPCSCIVYAGISDETSPATVVLFMRGGTVWNIAYAKPGDERWALMEDEGWKLLPSPRILEDGNACKYVRYVSAMTLRGRVYFPTYEGNILKVRVHPKPRLVPVINNQAFDVLYNNVTSYLVPADDNHRRMLMVRDYGSLHHLSETEQRSIKRRKNTDVIKLEYSSKPRLYSWHLIQVFKVDLAGKRLVPAVDIGRRAVFVGDVACVSLSTKTFPSVAGNAVYLGVNSLVSTGIGVRHMGDKSIEPPYEFGLEDGSKAFQPVHSLSQCRLTLGHPDDAFMLFEEHICACLIRTKFVYTVRIEPIEQHISESEIACKHQESNTCPDLHGAITELSMWWKRIVDEWMSSRDAIVDHTPQSMQPSGLEHEDRGLSSPSVDEGALFATPSTSIRFSEDNQGSKMFDGMDDDGNTRNSG